jgi:hypothetical protein
MILEYVIDILRAPKQSTNIRENSFSIHAFKLPLKSKGGVILPTLFKVINVHPSIIQ